MYLERIERAAGDHHGDVRQATRPALSRATVELMRGKLALAATVSCGRRPLTGRLRQHALRHDLACDETES
ncbi:MAG: hypothetical protein KIT48_17215 [Pseudolabrys sp.]|nr:hypothetical protein [Pseudolabrys sp.]